MFISRIDLLSQVPQISIFNAGSNKTVFGGALSLIYLIIFLLIAIAYLVDYISNDKYEVQYGIQQELLTAEKQIELNNNPDYNPSLSFYINLINEDGSPLSNRFQLFDLNNMKIFGKNEEINSRISDLFFIVIYKCDNESCIINDEDKVDFGYQMVLKYKGFKLDHQADVPLHKSDLYFSQGYYFFFNKPSLQYMQWGVIKYSEERSFLGVLYNLFGGEDDELIGGYFKSKEEFFVDGIIDDSQNREYINGSYYKFLGRFSGHVDYFEFEEYKRSKKGILDVFLI